MVELMNKDRMAPEQAAETHGKARPLQWDPRLAALARAHSLELENGSFSHVSPDGSLPSDRMSRAGIQWLSMGENIAMSQDVARAEASFMNEPGFQQNHRGNRERCASASARARRSVALHHTSGHEPDRQEGGLIDHDGTTAKPMRDHGAMVKRP